MNHELLAQLETKQQDLVWREGGPEQRLIRTELLATLIQPTLTTALLIKRASLFLLALGGLALIK